jgi:hypothetical protein
MGGSQCGSRHGNVRAESWCGGPILADSVTLDAPASEMTMRGGLPWSAFDFLFLRKPEVEKRDCAADECYSEVQTKGDWDDDGEGLSAAVHEKYGAPPGSAIFGGSCRTA